MRILLIIISICALILTGCAKANNPAQTSVMELISSIPTVGNPLDIDVSDDRIYVAEDLAGVSIIDRDSNQKTWFTAVKMQDNTINALGKIKNIAAVGSEHKLFVNEYSNTDHIWIVSTDKFDSEGSDHADSLYVIDDITGGTSAISEMRFQASEDSLDEYPVRGTYTSGSSCNSVGIKYMTEFSIWNHYPLSNVSTTTTLNGFCSTSQYLYLAARQRGLFIYNKSTGALVKEFDLPGEALRVEVQGNYAYVACRQSGLYVVDISTPTNPVITYSFDTTGYASNIAMDSHYLIVGSTSGGIYLFNLTNPSVPKLLEQNTNVGFVNDVAISHSQAIVATRDNGVMIFKLPE